jgi:hypothetical protein
MPLNITAPGTYTLTTDDRSITVQNTAGAVSIVLFAASSSPPPVNVALATGATAPVVTITSAGGLIGQLAGGTGSSFTMSSAVCTEATFQSDLTNWGLAFFSSKPSSDLSQYQA